MIHVYEYVNICVCRYKIRKSLPSYKATTIWDSIQHKFSSCIPHKFTIEETNTKGKVYKSKSTIRTYPTTKFHPRPKQRIPKLSLTTKGATYYNPSKNITLNLSKLANNLEICVKPFWEQQYI